MSSVGIVAMLGASVVGRDPGANTSVRDRSPSEVRVHVVAGIVKRPGSSRSNGRAPNATGCEVPVPVAPRESSSWIEARASDTTERLSTHGAGTSTVAAVPLPHSVRPGEANAVSCVPGTGAGGASSPSEVVPRSECVDVVIADCASRR
ncbi:MAG: hypothetical protein M5U19_16035 [Microthrixaceae bacterium]|nr:hypothetical protein [Microthrixaceae bacterium]